MIQRHAARRAGSSASVSIHVRDLAQLFNSLDPSPFWDRDLDRDAAAFIEDEFADKRSAGSWHLHVHAQAGEGLAEDLQRAIENYYTRLAASARNRLREHLRLGQLGLVAGVAIFLLCMGARRLLQQTVGEAPRALDEGLIVLGWVALWRPVETLAYEWVPLYRRQRMYQRLAAIRVSVRSAAKEEGRAILRAPAER